MNSEYVDVVIVGAGLSGIGAACRLRRECPGKSFTVLEARGAIGGTWDLFRYPGIRSDSDMHTLGYDFKPWTAEKAIADGPSILAYVRETARENDIDPHIRFGQRAVKAAWSSDDASWTIDVLGAESGETMQIRCNFLLMCSGYYRYESGHTPVFDGRDRFDGDVIHPQLWPEGYDYCGKKIVIIGSGATAMTLVPSMAEKAGHVVMLQRSPTYVISMPDKDVINKVLRWLLPDRWAYAITRWKNIAFQQWLYGRTRSNPEWVKKILLKRVRKELGPDFDVGKHFTPAYDPWDQRLCLVPNSDLFAAIRSGKASVVTDRIETFTEKGIQLRSGQHLDADVIVTATGLELVVLGETRFEVDGDAVDFADTWSYKGIMCSGVPNMISTFGYINASWTLRADLTAEYACRLINHMDEHGFRQCTPELRIGDHDMPARPWIADFSSGYIQRVLGQMPKQGDREPWLNPQDYRVDRTMFREAAIEDGVLAFSHASSDTPPA